MRPCLKLLDGATAINNPPANTAAASTMTVVAGASIVDLTFFILDDGINLPIQFVFAAAAITESATKRRITYTAGDSIATVKTTITSVVNGVTVALRITVTDPGGNDLTLTNDLPGAHGNTVTTNTTAHTAPNMTSGVDAGFTLMGDVLGTPYMWHGIDEGVFQLHSTAGSGVMTTTVRIWVYSRLLFRWLPLGISATVALRGVLNDGTAIAEDGADLLRHAEWVQGLSGFERIYAEVTAIGGTATAVDLFLNSCGRQGKS